MQYELPMWSPHPRAKLFKRYVFNSEVEREDGEKIKFENNKYVCHKTFKWQRESDLSVGKVQPIKGLIDEQANVTIRSTTVLEMHEDDIVFLQSTVSSQGAYFNIKSVSQDYIYCPKQVKSFVHLELESISREDISKWD